MSRFFRFTVLLLVALLAACRTETTILPTLIPSATPAPPTAIPTHTPTPKPTALPGIIPETIANDPSQQVYLRIVHAAPDAQPIDVYMELLAVATNLEFGRSTDQTGIVAGNYTLRVVPAGSKVDDKPLLSAPLSLKGGQSLILMVTGTPNALSLDTYAETSDPLDGNQSRVSIINGVPGGPAIGLREGNADIIAATAYGQMSRGVVVPSGEKPLIFMNGGNIVFTETVDLRERYNYTLVLLGRANDLSHLAVVEFESRVPGRSRVRAINASSPIGAIDVYLNDQVLAQNVGYGRASDRQNAVTSVYTVSVYAAGADRKTIQPLTTTQLNANPDDIVSLVVMGPADNLRIVTYREDLSPTPPTQTRIAFMNPLDTLPLVRVETQGGPIVGMPDLGYGQISPEIVLDTGTYSFYWKKFEGTQTGDSVELDSDLQLEAGRRYFYLLSGRADTPLILSDNVGVDQSLAPVTGETPSPTPIVPTQMRFVNAVSSGELVDFLMDDQVLLKGVAFGQGSDLLKIEPGSHVFTVQDDKTSALISRLENVFDQPGNYSLFAYGIETTRVDMLLVPDFDLAFDHQSPHLRLLNLTQDVDTRFALAYGASLSNIPTQPKPGVIITSQSPASVNFRVSIPVGMTRILNDIRSGSASATTRTPTGASDLIIIDAAQAALAATLPGVDLSAGVHYDVVAFQQVGSPEVKAFILPYPVG